MTCSFRMTGEFAARVREDLLRPHAHAYERVAFIAARAAASGDGLMLLASAYHPIADEDYDRDPAVGAQMREAAIRKAMQIAWQSKCAIVHVHLHDHRGTPGFGHLDLEENARFMPEFFNAQPHMPHAALLLSRDAAAGRVWRERGTGPVDFDVVIEAGWPMRISRRRQ